MRNKWQPSMQKHDEGCPAVYLSKLTARGMVFFLQLLYSRDSHILQVKKIWRSRLFKTSLYFQVTYQFGAEAPSWYKGKLLSNNDNLSSCSFGINGFNRNRLRFPCSLLSQIHTLFPPFPPPPPSKILHSHCFRFLWGYLHFPGEIANYDYVKLGVNKVSYGILENSTCFRLEHGNSWE